MEVDGEEELLDCHVDRMRNLFFYAHDVLEARHQLVNPRQPTGDHPFAIDAAMVGNLWQVNNYLENFLDTMEMIQADAARVALCVANGNATYYQTQRFALLALFTGANMEVAELVIDEYVNELDDDLVNDVLDLMRDANKSTRKSKLQILKEDAYADPAVAAMCELTQDGLKTRQNFYNRKN
jgi:hypothetical protein